MDLEEIPSFHPTEEEFKDFIAYISQEKVQIKAHKYGMIKIIPPKSFKPPMSLNLNSFKFNVRNQQLNALNLINRSRLFFMKQVNNYKKSILNKKISNLTNKPYVIIRTDPNHINSRKKLYLYDLYISILKYYNKDIDWVKLLTTVRDRNSKLFNLPSARDVERETKLWNDLSTDIGAPISEIKYTFKKHIKDYYNYICKQYSNTIPSDQLVTDNNPKSLLSDNDGTDSEIEEDDEKGNAEECPLCQQYDHIEHLITCFSCGKYFHVNCINRRPDETHITKIGEFKELPQMKTWICKNCMFGNGYYGFHISSKEYTIPEFIKMTHSDTDVKYDDTLLNQIEDEFWEDVNNIDKKTIVKYGADIHCTKLGASSGFPSPDYVPESQKDNMEEYLEYSKHPANLRNLPSSKGSLFPISNDYISGITFPWLYVGSKYSTFCWHMEDQYTLSANYQHEGAPKIWYSIPNSACMEFQNYLIQTTPDLFIRQPDLMHQLTSLVSPKVLKELNIPCYRAVQHPHEYIVTYPRCYHAGFNSGYNLNEAVNFTTEFWVPFGMEAIRDYRVTRKQSVFDMNDILIAIVHLSVHAETTKIKFSTQFSELAFRYLTIAFSRFVTSVIKIETNIKLKPIWVDKGRLQRKRSSRDTNNLGVQEIYDDHNTEYKESQIFCTHCKTLCSFGFVIHQREKTTKMKKRRSIYPRNYNNWIQFITTMQRERPHLSYEILCLPDYLILCDKATPEIIREQFQNDELYILKNINRIKRLLIDNRDQFVDGNMKMSEFFSII